MLFQITARNEETKQTKVKVGCASGQTFGDGFILYRSMW